MFIFYFQRSYGTSFSLIVSFLLVLFQIIMVVCVKSLIMEVSSVYNFDFSGQMEPPFSDIQYFTFNIPNKHVRVCFRQLADHGSVHQFNY